MQIFRRATSFNCQRQYEQRNIQNKTYVFFHGCESDVATLVTCI